jgi:hypothetical protein
VLFDWTWLVFIYKVSSIINFSLPRLLHTEVLTFKESNTKTPTIPGSIYSAIHTPVTPKHPTCEPPMKGGSIQWPGNLAGLFQGPHPVFNCLYPMGRSLGFCVLHCCMGPGHPHIQDMGLCLNSNHQLIGGQNHVLGFKLDWSVTLTYSHHCATIFLANEFSK